MVSIWSLHTQLILQVMNSSSDKTWCIFDPQKRVMKVEVQKGWKHGFGNWWRGHRGWRKYRAFENQKESLNIEQVTLRNACSNCCSAVSRSWVSTVKPPKSSRSSWHTYGHSSFASHNILYLYLIWKHSKYQITLNQDPIKTEVMTQVHFQTDSMLVRACFSFEGTPLLQRTKQQLK